MKISKKSGFSILEYSLLVVVVLAALLAMQIYFKRALAGRWKSSIDTFGFGRQYDSPEANPGN